MTGDVLYANRLFINAVLPLLKVIVEDITSFVICFEKVSAIFQISAWDMGDKIGIHYVVTDGQWKIIKGVYEEPDVELEFATAEELNGFFDGSSKKLPKLKGLLSHPCLFIKFLKTLLALASYLKMKKVPKDVNKKHLLVKLYFYLLSSGISQLNKAGHEDIHKWALASPDRVYAWTVHEEDDLNAYIRVKAGKSKAVRGRYKRSKPFFTMGFKDIDSALGILLQLDDFIEATAKGYLVMEGAPEYGALIGDFMMIIGNYAKGG